MTLKKHKKPLKNKKNVKTCFLNFCKKTKKRFYIYELLWLTGRRKNQQIDISTAVRLAETLQSGTTATSEAAPNLMPSLALVAFSADQMSPPYPGASVTSPQTVSTISSSSVVQATPCPLPSAHVHYRPEQNVVGQVKYSPASTGSGKEPMMSPEYGAVDLSPSGSQPRRAEMTSLATVTRATLPVIITDVVCDN